MKKKRKKLGKKLLSFLLTLAMVVGLMPGMSLTALADGTTYSPASDYTGYEALKTGDTTVQIEGVNIGDTIVDWYVIGYDSTDKTVTLLSKQSFENKPFNSNYEKGNAYASSEIKTYVEGLTGENQPLAGIKDALADISGKVTGNPDNISGAVPYLLSYAEANALSPTKKSGAADTWWLRSPGLIDVYAACVSGGKALDYGDTVNLEHAVRPALKLDLSKVTFDSESKTFSLAEGEATATAAETLAPTVDNDNKVTDAKILEYAGKQWYVIASGTTGVQIANDAVTTQAGETTLVLLAKDNWGANVIFSGSSNTYKDSNLESQMNSYCSTTAAEKIGNYYTGTDETWKNELIATRTLTGEASAGSNYQNEDNISGDSVTGATLWPLSAAEVSQINNSTILQGNGNWWLRSPGTNDTKAASVYSGSLGITPVRVAVGVRPALCLNLTSEIFTSEKSGESGVYELTKAEPAIEYPLWVGGTQVTSENASNIDGDNKASYDDSTHTLTLNGYSYTGVGHKENSDPDSPLAAIYYTGTDSLTIQLSGTSSITRTGNSSGTGADTAYGIHCSQGNLTIDGNGSGSLTVTGGELKTIYGIVATTVTIKNANVTSMGKGSSYGTGIYGKQGVTIQNATVTAEGKGYGISGDTGSAEIEESSSVTALGSIKAISGTVKNSIAGTGWTDTAGTEGQADIAKSSEGQSFTYKKVQFPAEPWLYNIKIPSSENGTVTAKVGVEEVTDDTTVEAGKTVTLNVTPNSGYRLKELSVTAVKEATTVADLAALMDTEKYIHSDDEYIIVSGSDIKYHSKTTDITLEGTAVLTKNGNTYGAVDSYQKNWEFSVDNGQLSSTIKRYGDKFVGKQTSKSLNSEVSVDTTGTTPTFTMPKGDVTVTATFEPGATAPTIETQPADLELTYGYTEGSVSVEATAAEDHELSYQWYSNTTNNTEGGKVIEGATKASYTIPTGKNADTVEYYYCVVTATFMDKTATTTSDVAEVNVKKADSSVKTAPKARDITYTGKPQALVEGGTAVGGEMRYALGDATEATQPYTTSIPTATNAGTYYVWYKVVGNDNYNDAEPVCVKVTIAEEKKQDEPETPAKTVDMYRLYNPNSGEHFYTASAGEKDFLVNVGWTYEGIGWKAPEKSNTPVYRLYNSNAGDHHYTTNKAERDNLISLGWKDEGIGWYSDDAQSLPIYRQYNPNAVSGAHNFTSSKGENDWLVSLGWSEEGIGWYGVK